MSDVPVTAAEALSRLRALGLDEAETGALFAHFDDAERRGKQGHGYSRIPWLEQQPFDRHGVPTKTRSGPELDRWRGNGALGYLTLQAICDDVIAAPPVPARVIVAAECFPTGRARLLGADARGGGGPRRRPHGDVPAASPPP